MKMTPRLAAIYGHLRDETIYLNESVNSIGRQLSNDIILDDPRASREHCLIRNVGQQYVIEDLQSANGTYVNGERVTEKSLTEGSLIQVGASRFLFRLQEFEGFLTLSRTPVERQKQPIAA